MNKKLYVSSEVASWNDSHSKCKDEQLELFILQSEEEKDYLVNAHDPLSPSKSFWFVSNITRHGDINPNQCYFFKINDKKVEFAFEECSKTYTFICQKTLKPNVRLLSTRNLLILVFLGIFIYFAMFFIFASRTQSKHELKQKNNNTELTEFNEEIPETVQSI